jgi:hypothetical protein
MIEKQDLAVDGGASLAPARCRKIGRFVEKDGCFALRGRDSDVWLEIDPVPLHLLDEQVEISGQQYGRDLVWVTAIGPVKGHS